VVNSVGGHSYTNAFLDAARQKFKECVNTVAVVKNENVRHCFVLHVGYTYCV